MRGYLDPPRYAHAGLVRHKAGKHSGKAGVRLNQHCGAAGDLTTCCYKDKAMNSTRFADRGNLLFSSQQQRIFVSSHPISREFKLTLFRSNGNSREPWPRAWRILPSCPRIAKIWRELYGPSVGPEHYCVNESAKKEKSVQLGVGGQR